MTKAVQYERWLEALNGFKTRPDHSITAASTIVVRFRVIKILHGLHDPWFLIAALVSEPATKPGRNGAGVRAVQDGGKAVTNISTDALNGEETPGEARLGDRTPSELVTGVFPQTPRIGDIIECRGAWLPNRGGVGRKFAASDIAFVTRANRPLAQVWLEEIGNSKLGLAWIRERPALGAFLDGILESGEDLFHGVRGRALESRLRKWRETPNYSAFERLIEQLTLRGACAGRGLTLGRVAYLHRLCVEGKTTLDDIVEGVTVKPYELWPRVPRTAFRTWREAAHDGGVYDHVSECRFGLLAVLEDARRDGHLWLPIERAEELLGELVEHQLVRGRIPVIAASMGGKAVIESGRIGLADTAMIESELAGAISRILGLHPPALERWEEVLGTVPPDLVQSALDQADLAVAPVPPALFEAGNTARLSCAEAVSAGAGQFSNGGGAAGALLRDWFEQKSGAVLEPATKPGLGRVAVGALTGATRLARIQLDQGQQEALAKIGAADCPLAILEGGPGTGKTTLTAHLCRMAQAAGFEVILASPTGKAAQRLSAATGAPATTIHRLLNIQSDAELRGDGGFSLKTSSRTLIVLDESSMIDVYLARAFFTAAAASPAAAAGGLRIVLVGDAHQLPPPGPGAVFRDLIISHHVRVASLEQVYRFEEQGKIARAAAAIREGGHFPKWRKYLNLIEVETVEAPAAQNGRKRLAASTNGAISMQVVACARELIVSGVSPDQVQVITPQKTTDAGTRQLNNALRKVMNPHGLFLTSAGMGGAFHGGDRVMVTRNMYRSAINLASGRIEPVYNGDQGVVRDLGRSGGLVVDFGLSGMGLFEIPAARLDLLEPCWAATAHKMQGSQSDYVIFALSRSHANLLTRDLVYTAITRAARELYVVGEVEALHGINRRQMATRETMLFAKLGGLCAEAGIKPASQRSLLPTENDSSLAGI